MNSHNSVSFHNVSYSRWGAHWAAFLVLLFSFLFFTRIEVVLAVEVDPPAWLSEEYMSAEHSEAEHKESASHSENAPLSAYTRTFIISAYYSPLPGQNRYVTGSYAGDIRLNGSGVNGADGTPVYPGMIAAPKTYAFGTKMKIPGIGTVAVHDRGGAIVSSGSRGNAHDRLDVWMGYGDKGLQRALNWGKRTVDVTVYGIDASIQESITLDGYSKGEGTPIPDSINAKPTPTVTTTPTFQPSAPVQKRLFSRELNLGHRGEDVAKLQKLLKDLNYYEGEINSVFDHATYNAVADFQVSENILNHKTSFGAGYVGPRTMSILAHKTPLPKAHAKVEEFDAIDIFASDLKRGDTGEDVRKLQEELRKVHLLGIEPTGYYGEVTEHAVYKFQQVYRLVGDKSSQGAGIFGPITRSKFNSVVAARLETDRQRILVSSR